MQREARRARRGVVGFNQIDRKLVGNLVLNINFRVFQIAADREREHQKRENQVGFHQKKYLFIHGKETSSGGRLAATKVEFFEDFEGFGLRA